MGIKKILLASAAIAVLASPAMSADRNGWYVGLGAGYSIVDGDMDIAAAPRPVDFDNGWNVHGSIGKAFANHWRIELDVGYRENDLSFTRIAPGPIVQNRTGNLSELTAFINAAYDWELGAKWALTTGAGIGMDRASLDVDAGGDDRDYELAYQGILELVYQASTHWDVYFGYRYLRAENVEFDGLRVFGVATDNVSMDLDKHLITLGVRYGYEAPAAPVVAAPPPPPPPPPAIKQFIVFFGFNKYNLTAEAQAVVAEAASAAKSQGAASIAIVGHTDTVGGNAYNQKLSEKRAGAVKDELVRLGIPGDKISAMGKGETELLVQTGDSVKEPQNRRATI
ncbi:MAG TPA: hypothetical protein DCL48_06375, partial [Alphaproteobacteria bacterium]|nr:hypothetical protein [Alphaproteobacteria bacterium]